MNPADIARRQALTELLATPDPPDLHRGSVLRFEGKPDRFQLLPQLAVAFVHARLAEIHGGARIPRSGR